MRGGVIRAMAISVVALSAAVVPATAAEAATPTLRAGVGKADITPQTGYVLGGWTRADRVGNGARGRLSSRALVLQRGSKKVALVQADLFMIPGGITQQVGDALKARGFSEQNILLSATHTHSGPGGFANFPTLNTTAPSTETVGDPGSFARLLAPSPADPMLYTFLVRQITAAIRRADDDLGPATAGWGSAKITGLTQNRSLEAHLANHGIIEPRGTGTVKQDPGGYLDTIDPDVAVLRVDKLRKVRFRGKRRSRLLRVPIGAWTSFANHGTVNKSEFQYYTQDHQGPAMDTFEARVRREGGVPAKQEVVNVFSNADEGDISSGLNRGGPVASDYVGQVEAGAMMEAWRNAAKVSSRTPALDSRWTRICFCGQVVEDGQRVASESSTGLPFLTGSEEGRGPLFDATGQIFEDRRGPDLGPPHGDKLTFPGLGAGVPHVVPLISIRLGTRMIASIPGEATKQVGTRIKTAVRAQLAGSGIKDVVLSGLANEFILYMTTPEEYDRQHYEGGNTQFGRQESNLVKQGVAQLAGTLARGQTAPAPYPFDPTNNVRPDGPDYGPGAASATITSQPAGTAARLQQVTMAWSGGPKGLDRPVDRAFVTAERLHRGKWQAVDTDLGSAMLWSVDSSGGYKVTWEIPRYVPRGTYRLAVTAKRYRLTSSTFRVGASPALTVQRIASRSGTVSVALAYPVAGEDALTYRPRFARGGKVRFRVGRRTVVVRRSNSPYFTVKAAAGTRVTVGRGAAKDSSANTNAAAFSSP